MAHLKGRSTELPRHLTGTGWEGRNVNTQRPKAKNTDSVLASASLLRDPTVWPTTFKTLSDVVRKLYEFRKDT